MSNGDRLKEQFELILISEYQKKPSQASIEELHHALAKALMISIHASWEDSRAKHTMGKRAYYFSAEFLMGRLLHNNLFAAKLYEQADELFRSYGYSLAMLEDIEDAALGNGGLGRLAACFLDSAATHNLPLDGYGIRYRYGFFKQSFGDGFQKEQGDNWSKYGDAWSVRRSEDTVSVEFADFSVLAVPYDMPILGYDTDNINTLRLWQSEAAAEFDFALFDQCKFAEAVKQKEEAERITQVLYPNDNTDEGKRLRLMQQYFFCSASLKDILRRHKAAYGDFETFADCYAIQLNDTHPAVAIPELIRLLTDYHGFEFHAAFSLAQQVFSYTNHTIMAEALEKWNTDLFKSVLPRVYEIIVMLNEHLIREFSAKGLSHEKIRSMMIVQNGEIHMARLSVYTAGKTNGVAEIHTEILKDRVLRDWYELYPQRFLNKTNGITQRRWLGLCNPELSALITSLLGNDLWLTDLHRLEDLTPFAGDEQVLRKLAAVKQLKKEQLCDYIKKQEGLDLDPTWVFSTQIKRLHEYKRQLLNAFAILDIYYDLKAGKLSDWNKAVYIFGAKSAPGYVRAKGIIKYIHEVARLINSDEAMQDKLKVVFVSNYNVSYAEKLIPAADVSEQISTAGTEASGTGNMKFMLNGTVTLGTYDGANIEIVKEAGEENNYIFGARVEELEGFREQYDPRALYQSNPHIKRVVDSLVDGSLSDGNTGLFADLHHALVGSKESDYYYLLHDFESYKEAKIRVNREYAEKIPFAQKCFLNIAKAGKFSSDRTIKEYAAEIWHIEQTE